jgi:hypothetical protein
LSRRGAQKYWTFNETGTLACNNTICPLTFLFICLGFIIKSITVAINITRAQLSSLQLRLRVGHDY